MQVLDAATGPLLFRSFPYPPTFTGRVWVAAADVNGDAVPDVITAPGPGGGSHVRVFDEAALRAGQAVELVGLMAYTPTFTGGDGDGVQAEHVRSGPICIDKYEASVWEAPTRRSSPSLGLERP